MAVSAKFRVSRLTPSWGSKVEDGMLVVVDEKGACGEVELTPDYAGGRNSEWAAATPAGVIRLTITNPAALAQFKEGQAFDVLLTPTEE